PIDMDPLEPELNGPEWGREPIHATNRAASSDVMSDCCTVGSGTKMAAFRFTKSRCQSRRRDGSLAPKTLGKRTAATGNLPCLKKTASAFLFPSQYCRCSAKVNHSALELTGRLSG